MGLALPSCSLQFTKLLAISSTPSPFQAGYSHWNHPCEEQVANGTAFAVTPACLSKTSNRFAARCLRRQSKPIPQMRPTAAAASCAPAPTPVFWAPPLAFFPVPCRFRQPSRPALATPTSPPPAATTKPITSVSTTRKRVNSEAAHDLAP
jgi:hypothetical protein